MKTLKINIDQVNIFFTSDQHFSHSNVIKFCDRPFNDVYHMNFVMVENWNNVVGENDTIFIIGDFCFGKKKDWDYLLSKLNGKKYLVVGNHDKNYTTEGFESVYPIINLRLIDDNGGDVQLVSLCHYPMISWYQSHRGSWQLFGHVHEKDVEHQRPEQLNVGVDKHNFTPVSLKKVREIINYQIDTDTVLKNFEKYY